MGSSSLTKVRTQVPLNWEHRVLPSDRQGSPPAQVLNCTQLWEDCCYTVPTGQLHWLTFLGPLLSQALCYPASIANAPIFRYRVKPSCSCSNQVRFPKRILLLSHTHGSSDLSTILVSEGKYCVTVFLFGPTNNSGQLPLKGRNGILISSPGQWFGGLNRILKIDLRSVIFDKLLNTLNLVMGEGVAPLSLCYLATYMALDFQDI